MQEAAAAFNRVNPTCTAPSSCNNHRPQVARTFRKLHAAAITNPADAAAVAAATARSYSSLRDVPSAAFPLFVTTAEWLRLLDASCDASFFGVGGGDEDERADVDGIGLHVDLGGWDSDDDEYESEEEEGEEEEADGQAGEEGEDGEDGEEGEEAVEIAVVAAGGFCRLFCQLCCPGCAGSLITVHPSTRPSIHS